MNLNKAINKTDLQTNANLNTDGSYDKKGYNIMQVGHIGSYSIAGLHAVGAIAWGLYNPYSWYAAGLNIAAGAYWTSVGIHINNGFDYDYSVLLRSYAYEKRNYSYLRMVCSENNSTFDEDAMFANTDRSSVKSNRQPQERCYYETVYETRTIATPSSHDGLVSTYSQLSF